MTTLKHRPAPGTAAPAAAQRTTAKTLFGIGTGNAVEWFDWAIYAIFASYIAQALFSKENPSSAFLATLGIFAVGFIARPIGGLLFGIIGDRIGRKTAMTAAVALAAFGSLLIAITPSYASIGTWASVILLVARLLQGLAHGGEMPSAQTYLAEIAPAKQRGLYSTLIYASGNGGIVVGTLLGAIFTMVLSPEQMHSFGWRIPFLIGALLGLYTLIMRARLQESEHFTQNKASDGKGAAKPSLYRDFMTNRIPALQVIGLTVGITVVYYIWSVSTPAHAISTLHIPASQALWVGVAANLVFIASLPLWGKLSDRIGRRPVMAISLIGASALQIPASLFVRDAWWQLLVSMIVMLVFIAGFAAIAPAVYAELFPTSVRTVGMAVPYAFSVALFGGTAAYLQAACDVWFGSNGALMFSIYAIILMLISAFTVYRIKESKGIDLHD